MPIRFSIVSIAEASKKTLIARNLAQHTGMDMQKALLYLKNLPVVVFPCIEESDAEHLNQVLQKLGCETRMVPVPPPEKPEQSREVQKKETPPEPIEPAVPEKKQTVPVSASINKPIVHRTKEQKEGNRGPVKTRKIRKEWMIIIGAAVVLVLLYVVQQIVPSVQLAQNRRTGARQKRTSVSRGTSNPETDSILKSVASQKNLSGRVRTLSQAVRSDPQNREARAMLSRAYSDSAGRLYDNEAMIRFYKMAISFNPKNEPAWNGLIRAYYAAGQPEKAKETEKKKSKQFARQYEKINRIINQYGTVKDAPRSEGELLVFGFSPFSKEKGLETVYQLCGELQAGTRFKKARITVYRGGFAGKLIVSPLAHLPGSFSEWKKIVGAE